MKKTLLIVSAILLSLSMSMPSYAAVCVAVTYEDPSEADSIGVESFGWDNLESFKEVELIQTNGFLTIFVQHEEEGASGPITFTSQFVGEDVYGLKRLPNGKLRIIGLRASPSSGRHWVLNPNAGADSSQVPLLVDIAGTVTAGVDVTFQSKLTTDSNYNSLQAASLSKDIGRCTP